MVPWLIPKHLHFGDQTLHQGAEAFILVLKATQASRWGADVCIHV